LTSFSAICKHRIFAVRSCGSLQNSTRHVVNYTQ